jgi:SPX domain protein involved in polyphosphate accumulation
MIDYSEGWRHELKFLLPASLIPALRDAFAPHVALDSYCGMRSDRMYTVRSIYYDSSDLDFFFEKVDGYEVRKKLRVRTYDSPGDHDGAFIEVKRKHGHYGYKDRLKLPLGHISGVLDLGNNQWRRSVPVYGHQRILGRMRELSTKMDLNPTLLATYDREAMLGVKNSRHRVTFDCNLRSRKAPALGDIYSEDLTRIFQDEFVMELKFDEWMPEWMGLIIADFGLTVGSYSKYCHGIEACWDYADLRHSASLKKSIKPEMNQKAAHG